MKLFDSIIRAVKVLGYPALYLKGLFDGKESAKKKIKKNNEKIRGIINRYKSRRVR